MVVDLLRRPYVQKVRFFADLNREDTIRWYQCRPGAKPLPFNTVFSSAVWDDSNPPTPPALPVGELKLPPLYTTWRYPLAGFGHCYVGTAQQFQQGLVAADLEGGSTWSDCCAPRGSPAQGVSRINSTVTPTVACVLWLIRESLIGLADGTPVSEWPDVSGFGNNVVEVQPALQPIKETDGSGAVIVNFNGRQSLSTAQALNLGTNHTTFLVAYTNAGLFGIGFFLAGVPDDESQAPSVTVDSVQYVANSTLLQWIPPGGYVPGGVYSVFRRNNYAAILQDGAILTQGIVPDEATLNLAEISAVPFQPSPTLKHCFFQEVKVFNGPLAEDDYISESNYLFSKYGVTANPPYFSVCQGCSQVSADVRFSPAGVTAAWGYGQVVATIGRISQANYSSEARGISLAISFHVP